MPLPPELISFDFLGKPSDADRINEGKIVVRAWFDYARQIIAATPPNPLEAKLALDALALANEQILTLFAYGHDASAADLEARFSRLSSSYEVSLKKIADSSPATSSGVRLESSASSSLDRLAYICNGADFRVEPFRKDIIHSEADFEVERKRVMHDLYKSIIEMTKGTMFDACSDDFMVHKPFKWFTDVSFATADPQKGTYSLYEVFMALPAIISIDWGGGKVERPFMSELKEYLDKVNNLVTSLFHSSHALRQYASETQYIELISSASFTQPSISKASVIDLIRYRAGGDWIGEDEDFFIVLRKILSKLMKFETKPDVSNDSTKTPDANLAITKGNISTYKADIERRNPFPVEHLPSDNSRLDSGGNWVGIASAADTFSWVEASLGPVPPKDSLASKLYDFAFRAAFAYMRATGEEERADRRPKLVNGRILNASFAFRKGSVLFNLDGYSKLSMEAKGSARNPISNQMATLHPALSLPMDWFVLVPVVGGGSIPLANMMTQDRWGDFDSNPDRIKAVLTSNPAKTWADQLGQAKYQLDFWNMTGSTARSFFPEDLRKMVVIQAGAHVKSDLTLSAILKEISDGGKEIRQGSANEILRRLYLTTGAMYDSKRMGDIYKDILLEIKVDVHGDVPTPDLFKNAAEYYISKTPPHEEIFKQLFVGSNGSYDTAVFREGFKTGNTELQVMHMFYLLLRAELERYVFTDDSMRAAEHLMHHGASGKINLGEDLQTKSGKHPLDFVQRRALEFYLSKLYNNMPEQFRRYGLTREIIRSTFKSVGIEDNDAARYYDLKFLLLTEKNELRQGAGRAPRFGGSLLSRVLHTVGTITNADDGVV